MISDVVIIGAGISGLYLGLEFLKMKQSVCILEKSNRLGGRVFSKKFKNSTYESGAGRFSNIHDKLMNLLNKYNLNDKIVPIQQADVKIFKNPNQYSNDINYYFKIIFDSKKDFRLSELVNMTTYEYLCIILGINKANHFIKLYGYNGEIYNANALCGLNILETDYKTKQYYILLGGLGQLIDKMYLDFIDKGGKIYKNTIVSDIMNNELDFKINTSNLLDSIKNTHYCKKLVLAIPPKDVLKLQPKQKKVRDAISGIVPINLLRVYYFYDESYQEIQSLKKVISDLDINYIIPINDKIIMISYTDTTKAKYWYNLYYNNKDKFIQQISDEFTQCTSIPLVPPNSISLEYWEDGVHVWDKSKDFIKNYRKTINPISNLYLANEAYSKSQGWIESSLEVCDYILKLLK